LGKPNELICSVGIILGAGNSTRTGNLDKIFYRIQGIPVILHSAIKFSKNPLIDYTIVVVSKDKINITKELLNQWSVHNVMVIEGGRRRQDSASKALSEIRENGIFKSVDLVAIHDGARPFFTQELLKKGILTAKKFKSAIPVIPVNETVKLIDKFEFVQKTLDRQLIYKSQTPQVFSLKTITRAYKDETKNVTDDAAMVELLGRKVKVFLGEYENIKITTLHDLNNSSFINYEAKDKLLRYGLGVDSHKLKSRLKLKLGGVRISHSKGLEGHSDGDVLLHSICDAILGALGLFDLGYHFPSDDPDLSGIDSRDMLMKILNMMKKNNFQVNHLDSTIIAQAPRISEYREEIENKLSELLGVRKSSVNVKATTTDLLGFIGKSEGIAAQSIVTLEKLGS